MKQESPELGPAVSSLSSQAKPRPMLAHRRTAAVVPADGVNTTRALSLHLMWGLCGGQDALLDQVSLTTPASGFSEPSAWSGPRLDSNLGLLGPVLARIL